jgi:hypothetical protein
MTAQSPDGRDPNAPADAPKGRQGRYRRAPERAPLTALTPGREQLLVHLSRCAVLSLPQVARLCGRSEKGARRQMRPLFDAGLVDVIPVGRAALADPEDPDDESLLWGSSPNVYMITEAGRRYLREAGR